MDEGVIVLNDIDTDVSDSFMDWIYEKMLPAAINAAALGDGRPSIKYRVYVLADRLLTAEFKSTLLDFIFGIIQNANATSVSALVLFAFENLPEKDPLPRLLVDACSVNDGLNYMRDEDKVLVPQLPKDFLAGVIMKLHQLGKVQAKDKRLQRRDYIVRA